MLGECCHITCILHIAISLRGLFSKQQSAIGYFLCLQYTKFKFVTLVLDRSGRYVLVE